MTFLLNGKVVVSWPFLGVPWLAAATLQSLPLSSRGFLPFCARASSPLLIKDTSHFRLRAYCTLLRPS